MVSTIVAEKTFNTVDHNLITKRKNLNAYIFCYTINNLYFYMNCMTNLLSMQVLVYEKPCFENSRCLSTLYNFAVDSCQQIFAVTMATANNCQRTHFWRARHSFSASFWV